MQLVKNGADTDTDAILCEHTTPNLFYLFSDLMHHSISMCVSEEGGTRSYCYLH